MAKARWSPSRICCSRKRPSLVDRTPAKPRCARGERSRLVLLLALLAAPACGGGGRGLLRGGPRPPAGPPGGGGGGGLPGGGRAPGAGGLATPPLTPGGRAAPGGADGTGPAAALFEPGWGHIDFDLGAPTRIVAGSLRGDNTD